MEQTNLSTLFKPIPLSASTTSTPYLPNDFITIAGSDINQTSQVYLLYEVPTDLLAKRFLLNTNLERFKLMVMINRHFFFF